MDRLVHRVPRDAELCGQEIQWLLVKDMGEEDGR